MTEQNEKSDRPSFAHKRKLRNYLLDVGLQLRYTAFIIAVAVFLTGVLGYKVYQATQESSRIVLLTVQADPVAGAELLARFQANDRIVLYGMAGFGCGAGALHSRRGDLADPQGGWASAQHRHHLPTHSRRSPAARAAPTAPRGRAASLSRPVQRDVRSLAHPYGRRHRSP